MADGGDRRLLGFLLAEEDAGRMQECEPEKVVHVQLPNLGLYGGEAFLTQGEDSWSLDLHLGSRNMLKVLQFLQTLVPEPDEDDDGFMCGVKEAADLVYGKLERQGFVAWLETGAKVDMASVPKGMRLVEKAEALYVGPFPTQDEAQSWLDKRNGVTRL